VAHSANLDSGADALEESIPVSASVMPPVRSIPSELFFGAVSPGALQTSHLQLAFRNSMAPNGTLNWSISRDMASLVAIEPTQIDAHTWQISAKLKAPEQSGSLFGTLHIKCNDLENGLEIPVIANVLARK
jgi:hypothetical protein